MVLSLDHHLRILIKSSANVQADQTIVEWKCTDLFINAWVWPKHLMGEVSCVSAIQRQFCIEKSRWEVESCLLSGIKKRPLLRGWFSVTTILISVRNTELVCCREVVRFSEGPLSEARLLITHCNY